jgi:hypothetical protein
MQAPWAVYGPYRGPDVLPEVSGHLLCPHDPDDWKSVRFEYKLLENGRFRGFGKAGGLHQSLMQVFGRTPDNNGMIFAGSIPRGGSRVSVATPGNGRAFREHSDVID